MAKKLHDALSELPGVSFTQKFESNQLFLIMPREVEDKLYEKYHFYFWNEAINEMRLVTSFDTTEEDIDDLIGYVRQLMK